MAAGAQWQMDGGSWQISGATVSNLSVGNHTVSFSGIDYWTKPANQTVSVKVKSAVKATGNYTFNGAGIYNGLFTNAEVTVGTAGMLQSLTVTTSGTFSGKLLLGASTSTITGLMSCHLPRLLNYSKGTNRPSLADPLWPQDGAIHRGIINSRPAIISSNFRAGQRPANFWVVEI
jgi:hypothetical protein